MTKFIRTSAVSLILMAQACVGIAQEQSNLNEEPWDQWAESNPSWVAEAQPHHVIGNIYYVGSVGLSSYLITSSQGHILLDGGLPQNAPMIVKSIEALNFDLADVKILINSHAHFDHSGGLAALKKLTGAKLLASAGDRGALETGTYQGSEDNLNYSAPPVAVDATVEDGQEISLGSTRLTAHITPGHSRGCTSWAMTAEQAARKYKVVFFCGATVAANTLEPEQYAGIVAAYRETFSKIRQWDIDVPLTNHPDFFFNQAEKATAKIAGDSLAYVDRERFRQGLHAQEVRFVKSLAQQRNYPDRIEEFSFSKQAAKQNLLNESLRYVFYEHGKIVEDLGLTAVSDLYGEYQYLDILAKLKDDTVVVISEPRSQNMSIGDAASNLVARVKFLLSNGVAAQNIGMIGASKGAFIVAAAADQLMSQDLKTVLLAGCAKTSVHAMRGQNIKLVGSVLTIRDSADLQASGSCQALADASPNLQAFSEIVLETRLSHGLIYRPLPEWLLPAKKWLSQ